MGSRYFFSCYNDFNSKDMDEIELVEQGDFRYMRWLHSKNHCLFQFKVMPSTQHYIDYALKRGDGLVVGKFLIPEFCEAIGFTINDLPKLLPLIKKLDEKHLYEKVIYDSYIQNNGFFLKEDQRNLAYKSYKESRGIL